MADVGFGSSQEYLKALQGKRVSIEMLGGESRGGSVASLTSFVRGDLETLYDDAILVRLLNGGQKLIFARAICSISGDENHDW